MNILKTLIFTIIAPGTATLYVPYLLLVSTEGSFPPALSILWPISALMIITGAIGYLWSAWDFATIGQGTPLPLDPPKNFVVHGPYRFTRNPMYVSIFLIITGEAIMFASLALVIYALIFWTIVQLFVVFYEEPNLRQRFGSSYEDYYQSVPRWLIPKRLFQRHS